MKIEYALEIYNKYENFVEQIDVFDTYEEACEKAKKGDIDIDPDSEYFEVTEIKYDDDENEISRVGLVVK